MSRDEIAAVLARIARENAINCTGPGEVGCRGRKGWHSWADHHEHVAEAQAAALDRAQRIGGGQ